MEEKIIARKKIDLMYVAAEKNHGNKKEQVGQELEQLEVQFGEVVV